jgi:hypothetical protein
MGLIAGGDTNSLSVRHGIEYLLETQRPDGGWDEELATGTGFPKVFYLNYHYYRLLPADSRYPFVKPARLSAASKDRIMRFPLSMTAGMAGYIFKNKMRPRPEWQKNAAAAPDTANPFRILHAPRPAEPSASRIP